MIKIHLIELKPNNLQKFSKKFNLYEPHITIDPLDIMKKRIQLILDESNENILNT